MLPEDVQARAKAAVSLPELLGNSGGKLLHFGTTLPDFAEDFFDALKPCVASLRSMDVTVFQGQCAWVCTHIC